MRVFVTGATGFIGSAIVEELLAAGHQVLGLARSDASAEALARAGASVHRGELADVESLAEGARASDAVIHTAFIHDFSRYRENAETDQRAVEAMAAALEGSGKALVVTSGTAVLRSGRLATEDDEPERENPLALRAATEDVVIAASARGVRGVVLRLPPSVHGAGDHGFVPALIGIARRAGFAAYVGDGRNRWPAVHRRDAARLYRLGVENAAPGTRLHGAAEEGIPMRAIAETIGQGLGIPARGIPAEEAAAHFGWLAPFAQADKPVSSAITRETMGWEPRGQGLLIDMMESGYFG